METARKASLSVSPESKDKPEKDNSKDKDKDKEKGKEKDKDGKGKKEDEPRSRLKKPLPTGPRPHRWFKLAIATLILINLPFGIAAVVYSVKSKRSYRDCEQARATWEGSCALKFIIAGIVFSLVLYIAAFITMFALIIRRSSCVFS